MENKDIRWRQRFENYKKALDRLSVFVKQQQLNELEEQGLIKAFEYTYELGWNTIKDFYEEQGEANLQGGRDAIQLAFKRGLIKDGEGWMEMLKDRNRTSHTYNEETAREIVKAILAGYFGLFKELQSEFEKIRA